MYNDLKSNVDSLMEDFYEEYDNLPESFNWMVNDSEDSEYTKKRKQLISKPRNQYGLGICWATGSTTAISDAFVIKGITDWNPHISDTYALTVFHAAGSCSGGYAEILFHNAVYLKKGFASDACIDYSWCSGSKECTSIEGVDHFNNKIQKFIENLPTEGCYDNSVNHLMYFIDKFFYIDNTLLYSPLEIEQIIKIQILTRSTVPVNIVIMDDFYEEEFWNYKETKGIYFEKPSSKIVGKHAVCVVGWGTEEFSDDEGKFEIKYWICRNSWGQKWGENGYFKLGSYPSNKICQIENPSTIELDNDEIFYPRICFIDVTDYPKIASFEKTKLKNNFFLKKPLEFYTTNENKLIADGFFNKYSDKYTYKNCQDFYNVNCKLSEVVFSDNY